MKKRLVTFLTLSCLFLSSQTPADDPTWQMVFSEEFNSLDHTIWKTEDYYDNFGKYQAVMLQNNVSIQNGNLILTAKRENNIACPPQFQAGNCLCEHFCNAPIYKYSGGWVESINTNFYYGFYEVRAKMDFRTGFFPAIWLLTGNNHYSEIDICEIVGTGNRVYDNPNNILVMNNNMFTSNLHGGTIVTPQEIDPAFAAAAYSELPINDYTQYHVYGFDWQANKMSFYIDNQLIRVIDNPNAVLGNSWFQKFDVPMKMIFDVKISQEIEEAYFQYNITPDYPGNMYIDYFKYYQLKGNCSPAITACNYNFSTHLNTTKQLINIGGNNCTDVIPLDQPYIFRASSYIQLNDGFEVPIGATFLADANNYCQQSPVNTQNCHIIFNPCNYDFSGYINNIKQVIKISGANCEAIVNPSDNVHLKAFDYINLKEGFSVPLGSELEAKITSCQ